jgi:hypothetical protein
MSAFNNPVNRRVFLKGGALSLVTLGLSPSFLRRTALAMELPPHLTRPNTLMLRYPLFVLKANRLGVRK